MSTRWDTDPDYRARIRAHVRKTRLEQGLPEKITDAAALDRVAAVLVRHEAQVAAEAGRRKVDQATADESAA